MSLLAVEGAIDDIAGIRQRRRELTIQIRIIFNDEQAQAGLRM
jgi:poly-beta-hydroxyalkanoate depolymerase